MSTSPNLIDRFSEVAAASCADQLVRQILTANTAPPTKAWNKQRAERRTLWFRLAECAQTQVEALDETVAVKRRKLPTVAATNVPITAAHIEEAAS